MFGVDVDVAFLEKQREPGKPGQPLAAVDGTQGMVWFLGDDGTSAV